MVPKSCETAFDDAIYDLNFYTIIECVELIYLGEHFEVVVVAQSSTRLLDLSASFDCFRKRLR